MKDSKEETEKREQLEKEAEAARMVGVDDGLYYKEDDDPTWQTDTGDGC